MISQISQDSQKLGTFWPHWDITDQAFREITVLTGNALSENMICFKTIQAGTIDSMFLCVLLYNNLSYQIERIRTIYKRYMNGYVISQKENYMSTRQICFQGLIELKDVSIGDELKERSRINFQWVAVSLLLFTRLQSFKRNIDFEIYLVSHINMKIYVRNMRQATRS